MVAMRIIKEGGGYRDQAVSYASTNSRVALLA